MYNILYISINISINDCFDPLGARAQGRLRVMERTRWGRLFGFTAPRLVRAEEVPPEAPRPEEKKPDEAGSTYHKSLASTV